MSTAMSQSHKMDSSRAFLSSPFLRFVNVTCEQAGKEGGKHRIESDKPDG